MIGRKLKSILVGKRKINQSKMLRKNGLIFIHIPKNAGTSIYKGLGFENTTHIKVSEIFQNSENEKLWKSHFSFAVVRHPIQRFISLYNYARMEISDYHNNINPENSLYGIHMDYLRLKDKTLDECVDLLIHNELRHDHHCNQWFPQYTWVYHNKELAVNKCYKIEELETLQKDLEEKFGISLVIQQLNSSNPSAYKIQELSSSSKEKLYNYYRLDFELFNYDMD